MEVATFEHRLGSQWSEDAFPELDSEQTLVLTFGSRAYLDQPEALRELREAYPRSTVVGCSSAGEIHQTRVDDETLSVAVAKFDKTAIEEASVEVAQIEDSTAAGRRLAEALEDDDLAAIFVLSKGTEVNGTGLVEGINAELGSEVLVTGGLAGDGDRFERTWVLDEGDPRDSLVSAVGLYGNDLRFSHGSKGGWDRFGPEREVTRSQGSVLYELDGQPALKLYKRYLGEQAEDLPASGLLYPLAIHSRESDERLVRTILAIDEDDQSLTFAGDIPEGARAQLMKANFHRLIDGAAGAAGACVEMSDHQGEVLAIAISCVGRRLVLKERIEDELHAVDEVLTDGAHMVGFYSYGELSPYVEGADCALHNQTMTLTVLSEE